MACATLPHLTHEQIERLVVAYEQGWLDGVNGAGCDSTEETPEVLAYRLGRARGELAGMPASGLRQ